MRGPGKHQAVVPAAVATAAVVVVVALIWSGADRVEPGGTGAEATLRIEVRRDTTADLEAARRALEAQTPGPLVAAIGSVVPPGTSDEAVRELALLVNLICHADTTRAGALARLQDRGLDAATAAQVLAAAGRVQPCPAAGT